MGDINLVSGDNPIQSLRFILPNCQKLRYNKGRWTPTEDSRLLEVVRGHGARRWATIANLVRGRSCKQCRERWYNTLRPGINRGIWTPTEERILKNAHTELGNKWACIARMIPGRTENMVKVHWNSKQRQRQFPMDYKLPSNSGNQSALLQTYARTISTQESYSINEMANNEEVTQVLVEKDKAKNFDLNELPFDDDE